MKDFELHLKCQGTHSYSECQHTVFVLVMGEKDKNNEQHILNIVEGSLTKQLMDDYNEQRSFGSSGSIDLIEHKLKSLYRKAKKTRRADIGYRFSEIPIFIASAITRRFKRNR